MVLGFKKQFVGKIINGRKIHTIREDRGRRWKAGMKIHFATGVRTKGYHQFNEGECVSVQMVWLRPEHQTIWVEIPGGARKVPQRLHWVFAENDGFDSVKEFWQWFDKPFTGVIIHWTGFRYYPKATTEADDWFKSARPAQ